MKISRSDIALELVGKFPYLAKLKVSSNSALKAIALKIFVLNTSSGFFPQLPSVIRWSVKQVTNNHNKKKALELVGLLCDKMKSLNFIEAEDIYRDVMLMATQWDILEIVEQIVETFPSSIYCSDPLTFKTILHVAAENRSENTFNFIYRMSGQRKQLYLDIPDIDGNTLLHMAAKSAPVHKVNEISNPAIRMQYEVLWYKEIEKLVHPHCKARLNHAGKSARMMFTDEHENLRQQGEKWIKNTTGSCLVASTLICSIMYAASITIPGGNDSNTGLPILYEDHVYAAFRTSDLYALLFAVISLLLFIIIASLPYSEKNYLVLPIVVHTGLILLINSVLCMMASYLSAFNVNVSRGHSSPSMMFCFTSTFVCYFVMHFPVLYGVFNTPLFYPIRFILLKKKFV